MLILNKNLKKVVTSNYHLLLFAELAGIDGDLNWNIVLYQLNGVIIL